MLHVDEGRLAAYLDGQFAGAAGETGEIELHLAACTDCRVRLEEMLSYRDKARAILRATGGQAAQVPSFDEILKRAGKRSAYRPGSGVWFRPAALARAATILLAAGGAWYLGTRISERSSQAELAGGRFAEPSSVREEEQDESRTALQDSSPVPVTSQDRDLVALAPPANPVAATGDSGVPSGRAASAQARADLAEGAPAVPAPAQDRIAARDAEGPAKAEAARNVASAAEAKKLDSGAANAAPAAAEDARRRQQVTQPPAAAGLPMAVIASVVWVDTTEAEATRILGRRPFIVDGLSVSGYSVDASEGVQVRQLTNDGIWVSVTQRRMSLAGQAAAFAAREQASLQSSGGLTVEREGYSITVAAPVSRDTVAALLSRLR